MEAKKLTRKYYNYFKTFDQQSALGQFKIRTDLTLQPSRKIFIL